MARKVSAGLDSMYSGRAASEVTPVELLDEAALKPKRGPRSKGLVKAMFSLEPRQLEALRREATRRAERDPDVKAGRRSFRAAVDAGALVREAVDAWLAKSAASDEDDDDPPARAATPDVESAERLPRGKHDTAVSGRKLAAPRLEASEEDRQAMRAQEVAVGSEANGKGDVSTEDADRDRRTGLKKGTRWWHCTRCGSSVPAPRVNPGPCACGGGLVPSIRPKRGEGRRYARHAPR